MGWVSRLRPGVRDKARHVHTTDTRVRDGRSGEVADQAENSTPERAASHRRVARGRSRCIAPRKPLVAGRHTVASGQQAVMNTGHRGRRGRAAASSGQTTTVGGQASVSEKMTPQAPHGDRASPSRTPHTEPPRQPPSDRRLFPDRFHRPPPRGPRGAKCQPQRPRNRPLAGHSLRALFRTRTGDPFLTMEVLYQLS
jgi:hypothetical protein